MKEVTIKMNELYLAHHGIEGMKWGIRRYQNKDGTLTPAGKKRYARDVRDNLGKKKDNRIDTSNPDPNRWVREDLERKKRAVDTGSSLIKELRNLEKESSPKPTKKKMDLSKMSDKEMRDQINRKLLERQYQQLFSEIEEPQISKGREYVKNVLSVAGNTLTLTSSALAIALSIKELRG